jgi:hypothetical protein
MVQRALTIEEICVKLRPVYGKKIDDLYLQYAMADSREEKEEMGQVLNALYHKNLSQLLDRNVLLEPPKEEFVRGEYPLGAVSYASKKLYDFALREHDFPRHVCVSGMSGSGKTTFAFQILRNFMEKDKPFFVFDWKKSFRPLLSEDKNMMCFTVGDDKVSNTFRTNINRPPKGVNPKEWINVLCDLLTESFSVSFGVHKVLLETLDELYEGWGVYKDAKDYPTWRHVKRMLEEKMANTKGAREATWLESALRIASVLTFGSFGEVINSEERNSVLVDDLFKSKVIFELSALGNIEKKFFCEFVLTYIYKLKKARENTNRDNFEHAILVDEAHNIFLKDKTNFVNESVTDMVYREMREYGTSLICLDQHISKLSDTVKGNSACHVAFQQQLPEDIRDISLLMQLGDNKEYFSKLVVGSAIVKLAERYTSPFLIEVPFVQSEEKVIDNEEIKKRMGFLLDALNFSKKVDPEFSEKVLNPERVEVKLNEVPSNDTHRGTRTCDAGGLKSESNIEIKPIEVPVEEVVVPKSVSVEATPLVMDEIPVVGEVEATGLSGAESVLYDLVCERLKLGDSFFEIKNILDSGLGEGLYSEEDVVNVIDYAMKKKLEEARADESKSESGFEIKDSHIDGISNGLEISISSDEESGVEHVVEIIENEKIKEDAKKVEKVEGIVDNGKEKTLKVLKSNILKDLAADEVSLISFLIDNPDHTESTVGLYKKVGLSPRRGNNAKKALMDRDLVCVHEEKNEKGWKKYVKISQEFGSYIQMHTQ